MPITNKAAAQDERCTSVLSHKISGDLQGIFVQLNYRIGNKFQA